MFTFHTREPGLPAAEEFTQNLLTSSYSKVHSSNRQIPQQEKLSRGKARRSPYSHPFPCASSLPQRGFPGFDYKLARAFPSCSICGLFKERKAYHQGISGSYQTEESLGRVRVWPIASIVPGNRTLHGVEIWVSDSITFLIHRLCWLPNVEVNSGHLLQNAIVPLSVPNQSSCAFHTDTFYTC